MDNLKIHNQAITLVDQVEDQLLTYFRKNNLLPGDSIPNEMELANALGVARSVLREALSRLKMLGLIECRTRRGMMLKEPTFLGAIKKIVDPRILSENTLFDILEFRIALEIGMCEDLFYYITPQDIQELEDIVKLNTLFENNEYSISDEFSFHAKLYQITRNKTIIEFQDIIHPVMAFVKEKFKLLIEPINVELKDNNEIVTHAMLLDLLRGGKCDEYRQALEKHFKVYKILNRNRQK